jgi:serine/threonine-protein kinase
MRGPDPMLGRWILDQFHIQQIIGKGGMGRVYLARQASLDRNAAIKIVHVASENKRWRFRNEARAISRLSHENIVTVYNFGELADGSLFLAMEYVEGPTLARVLEQGRMDLQRGLRLLLQCASALAYAHQRGVVHRDLKPQNLILGRSAGHEQVKILDFGLARLLEDAQGTTEGALLGTPMYMSPEQWNGEPATALSDQYAFGLLAYEILAGRPVFESRTSYGYFKKHISAAPPPLSGGGLGSYAALLSPLVERALAKQATDRFADMRELRDELAQVVAKLGPVDGVADEQLAELQEVEAPRERAPGAGEPVGKTPSVVSLVGVAGVETEALLGADRIAELEQSGFLCQEVAGDGSAPELNLLGATEEGWREGWSRWQRGGASPQATLLCLDASPRAAGALASIAAVQQVLIAPYPLPPLLVSLALRWIQGRGDLITHFRPEQVQLLQIASSRHKSSYVDSVLEDLQSHGVRGSVRRDVKALCEEMIMNAIFHAPVDPVRHRLYAHLPRDKSVDLQQGREALLRWVFDRRYLAISVKDLFGSLTADALVTALTPGNQDRLRDPEAVGASLGLQIMNEAAHHIIFSIRPGRSCEVLALIDLDPDARTDRGCSLCALRGVAHEEYAVGARLWAREVKDADALHIYLRGEINESSDLDAIFQRQGKVRLELGAVSSINSTGVLRWMRAKEKSHPFLELYLECCSPAIVKQLNMIQSFARGAKILSIQLPYYCPGCGKETTWLLELSGQREPEAPELFCADCDTPLEFEDIPGRYFSFLSFL